MVTGNVAQNPSHHVTYAPVKVEVNASNGKIGDTFTRKYIIYLARNVSQIAVATSIGLGGDAFTRYITAVRSNARTHIRTHAHTHARTYARIARQPDD